MSQPEPPTYLRTGEVAKLLRVMPATARRFAVRYGWDHFYAGTHMRIRRADVEAFMARDPKDDPR